MAKGSLAEYTVGFGSIQLWRSLAIATFLAASSCGEYAEETLWQHPVVPKHQLGQHPVAAGKCEASEAESSLHQTMGRIASGNILSLDEVSIVAGNPRVGLLLLNPSKGKNSHQELNQPFKQFLLQQPTFLQRYVILAHNKNCKKNRMLLKKATSQILASWRAMHSCGCYFMAHVRGNNDKIVVTHTMFLTR